MSPKSKKEQPPVVIVLHGLARNASAMTSMVKALQAAKLDAYAYDYPSTAAPIDKLARQLASRIRQDYKDRRLYAVTHSLGGIVLRHMRDDRLRWQRIVMLAPPNGGSAVAASIIAGGGLSSAVFGLTMGPAGGALGAAKTQEKPWPFPPAPFGVIAGTRRRDVHNPTSLLVSHRVFADDVDHDGTVAVEETKLVGMAGFVTVDACHTNIMDDPEVQRLTVGFLRRGVFEAAEVAKPAGDEPQQPRLPNSCD